MGIIAGEKRKGGKAESGKRKAETGSGLPRAKVGTGKGRLRLAGRSARRCDETVISAETDPVFCLVNARVRVCVYFLAAS